MPRPGVAFAFVSALAAWPLPAQSAAPPVERIEVRLAQFDVVVRDKRGLLITGLDVDSFAVYEEGSPLEIVAVDEWGAPQRVSVPQEGGTSSTPPAASQQVPVSEHGGAASKPERRSFIFVFDALGESTALRLNQTKNAAAKFVRENLRPDDLAGVYQLDLGLRAVSGVTSNAQETLGGIAKVSWMSASSLQDGIAESILSYGSTGATPLMQQRLAQQSISSAQELDWQREHVYASLNDLASVFGALPGRRILVLASPGFSMTAAGDPRSGVGGFTEKFRQLIRSLATYGITVYALDLGNDLAAGDVSEKIDWRIAVGKLGMDENTLSDLGLERSLGSSSASARREFLGVIAAESGGKLLGHTDLAKAFAAIQEESTRFYRISCRVPVTSSTSRYRKLVVKVKTPGYSATSRKGRYSDVTPLARAPSGGVAPVESVDRFLPITARGIAIPLPGIDPKKVPVDVLIEALGPIQLPSNAQGDAALDVEFRLVARAEAEVVDRYERSFTARIKRDGVAAVRRGFRVEGRLSLLPGIYQLQGSVRLGDPPQLASWTGDVAVPPPAKGSTPAIFGAIVTASDVLESPLLSRPQLADDADPLLLKPGVRMLPTTRPDLEAGGTLLVLFWLRGLPELQAGQPPELDLTVEVAGSEGRALPVPTKIVFFGREPSGGYRAVAEVGAETLAPGRYDLRLAARMTGRDGSHARYTVPLTLTPRAAAEPVTSSSAPTP